MIYILASHGHYAKYAKESCEMITGATENFYSVSFLDDMSIDDLVFKYKSYIDDHKNDEITIIVDIFGGTPFNAAIKLIEEYPNIKIVSGLSLSLLIPLSLGESIESAIDSTKKLLDFVKINTNELNEEDFEEVEEE